MPGILFFTRTVYTPRCLRQAQAPEASVVELVETTDVEGTDIEGYGFSGVVLLIL